MTETLNYDPTDPDAPEFTEDEQNSLEVAEKLGQEENELLAGKYRNAEELEEAYLELQKKLGSDDDDEVEDTTLDEDEIEYDENVVAGVELIEDASQEYYDNNGDLTEDTLQRFKAMDGEDLVNAFMAIQENNPEAVAKNYPDLTDAEMNTVYNSVGGEAEYDKLTSWAADNMDDKALDAFNSIIDQGNPTAIQIAVAGMKAEYDNVEGYEGRMLQGKAAKNSRDAFRSQAEVVAAMSDPRYDKDPAYRQDLYDKLERSNVNF